MVILLKDRVIITIVITCLFFFLGPHKLKAEEVSLKESLNIALINNIGLKKVRLDLLETSSNYEIAKQVFQSSLSVNSSIGEDLNNEQYAENVITYNILQDLLQGDTLSVVNTNTTDTDTYGGHQLDIVYIRPILRGAGLTIGRFNIDEKYRNFKKSLFEYDLAEQYIAYEVINKYFNVIKAGERITVKEKALEIAKSSLLRTERLLDEQMATKIEVGRAETLYYETENDLIQSQKSLLDSIDEFRRFLGLDPSKEITPARFIPYSPKELGTLEEYTDIALKQRVELKQMGIEIDQKKADLELAQNSLKPDVDLYGEYHLNPNLSYIGENPRTTYGLWALGVKADFLFNDISSWEGEKIAYRNLVYTRAGFEQMRFDIIKEVRGVLEQIKNTEELIKLYEISLQKAKESLSAAEISWKEGIIQNRDVLESQKTLFATQVSLNNAKIDYILSLAKLEYLIGSDLVNLILSLEEKYEEK